MRAGGRGPHGPPRRTHRHPPNAQNPRRSPRLSRYETGSKKWLEKRREVQGRRIAIFRTLMATRAARLAPAHVEALNAIPLEFYGAAPELKAVVDAFKSYLAHLGASEDVMANPVWTPKGNELFFDLLATMAKHLHYAFNRVELEREFYAPRGHQVLESDQDVIRQGMASLFRGTKAIPMDVKTLPFDADALAKQKQLQDAFLRWLHNGAPVTFNPPPSLGPTSVPPPPR
ncbi:DUF6680 family protein [Roseomonas gilardii]|uniref:DUF6680 family protein n=1 Tax=Roseomonas gilardii TaxID=257708 RepID=UPI00351A5557